MRHHSSRRQDPTKDRELDAAEARHLVAHKQGRTAPTNELSTVESTSQTRLYRAKGGGRNVVARSVRPAHQLRSVTRRRRVAEPAQQRTSELRGGLGDPVQAAEVAGWTSGAISTLGSSDRLAGRRLTRLLSLLRPLSGSAAYVDNNLIGTGSIAQAAILGQAGGVWATSSGFTVSRFSFRLRCWYRG